MEESKSIALVKAKDSLSVQALDALAVGLIYRRSISLVETDLPGFLMQEFLFLLAIPSCQLVCHLYEFELVGRGSFWNSECGDRGCAEPRDLFKLVAEPLRHSLMQLFRLYIAVEGQVWEYG